MKVIPCLENNYLMLALKNVALVFKTFYANSDSRQRIKPNCVAPTSSFSQWPLKKLKDVGAMLPLSDMILRVASPFRKFCRLV